MTSLRFDSGPLAGQTVPLDKDRITFGRHDTCDFVLKHPTVSREHFHIERNGGKIFVVDHDSNNGTFANEKRVTWTELKNGDTIRAGPFTMTVELTASESARRDEPPSDEAASDERRGFHAGHERIYPREYLAGIEYFNDRRYFDAHEAWEEIWLRSTGDAKLFYQMLIQAAVGLHHYERDNWRGANGMYRNVTEKAPRLPAVFMSLDLIDFLRQFKTLFADLSEQGIQSAPSTEKPRLRIRLLNGDFND
jgi:uncharacterized protein